MKSFVSTSTYDSKPSNPVCGKITNQLKQGDIEVTPHQLAEFICCGHTVCPVFPSKKIGEKSTIWYIGFDFDKVNVDMEERLKWLKDAPTIAYHTFSHLLDGIRYRFIYVFSEPIIGKEFYEYQRKLIERNHFDNVDPNSQNINRLLHGTKHPVHYSGILYDRKMNPIQYEDADVVRRDKASPPPLMDSTKPYTPTAEEISILTSVGVSEDVAQYYYSHTWDKYLSHYVTDSTIQTESEYVPVDGECYSVAPEEFYSLPRQYRWIHEEVNGHTHVVVKPRKWKDGNQRGRKLYNAIITLRTLNQDATASDLLYYTVSEFCNFYNNYNSDGCTYKYDRRGLAKAFSDGMRADITISRKSLKHSSIRITGDGVNKHVEAPKAVARERHKKILSLYDPSLDMDANLCNIRETLNIHLSERTLKKILKNVPAISQQPTHGDRVEVFKCMYDSSKSDRENLRVMQDNIQMSKATYYRLKQELLHN